ncbi:bifunctional DNA-formamidopyrimidine glycosylase/DNA-(apurinic or apyrimidinic site) lyase [Aurantivibrio infirmus]
MPELPEVETTLRGIAPHIVGKSIKNAVVRCEKLRWPIPQDLPEILRKRKVLAVERRGKYLIIKFNHGALILHLGMSGNLRIVSKRSAAKKHDHVDWELNSGQILRFTDPRRFGAVLWTTDSAENHKLLSTLGPEPLSEDFNGELLFQQSRKRKVSIKSFIMDSHIVVGVGNIYANEALFLSGIRPSKPAGKVSRAKHALLSEQIKEVLGKAISAGGTTLKDFVGSDGKPGYFKQQLFVYGRAGQACVICEQTLKEIRISQRSTVYCSHCQG